MKQRTKTTSKRHAETILKKYLVVNKKETYDIVSNTMAKIVVQYAYTLLCTQYNQHNNIYLVSSS